jgi:ComF family protein
VERWLLPAECLLCERPISSSENDPLVCALCRARWLPLPDPFCARCGQPLEGDLECRICPAWRPEFTGVRSAVWLTGTARAAVHHLKYSGWWRVVEAMAPAMRRLEPLAGAVVLVPVPLGAARRRERGYNQSELLANALSRLLDIPVRPDLLRRRRDTDRQTGLAPDARRANVAGAFEGRRPGGRRAVLVDDVFTTGATLHAAAEALFDAGAGEVSAVTFARARRPLDDL